MTRRQLAAALAWAPARVRLGCQTRSFAPPTRDREKLLGILDGIAAAGFAGFETNYIGFEASFTDPAPAREEIARRKLELIGLHLGARFKPAGEAEKSTPLVARVARGVKALGGSLVIVSGTASGDAAALQAKAHWVRQAGRICREEGVRLVLHNHVEEARDDWAEYRLLMRETDAGLLVDVGHPARQRLDATAFLREFHARIAAIHVNDWTGETPRRLGTGDARLEEIGRTLNAVKWAGWAILELEGGKTEGGSVDGLVRESARFLRERMKFG
jgi:sugar phosphate isomerase/epimerase